MKEAARLVHRALGRPLARYCVSPRFDPIFRDGPSVQWLRMNWRAYRSFRGLRPESLVHVGMFSFSRAGTHLFESQFHYIRSCFCFGESFPDFRDGLIWRNFLCQGMYRTDSIQDKQGRDITHVLYNCNKRPRLIDHPMWNEDLSEIRRKWVLVVRNPLRILISRKATGKQKWQFTERSVGEFFDWYDKARVHFTRLLDRRPGDTHIISVEQFAKQPENVLEDLSQRIGLDARQIGHRPGPRAFFKTLSRTGEAPVERDGLLASPTRDIAIRGWGGEFNPLLDLAPDRLYRHDIETEIPQDLLRLSRQRLGDRAFEFFMTDRDHRYGGVEAADLLKL